MINVNLFKMKANISLILLCLLLLFTQLSCNADDLSDDIDLTVEDEPSDSEEVKTQPNLSKKHHNDDGDEFDDPVLLQSHQGGKPKQPQAQKASQGQTHNYSKDDKDDDYPRSKWDLITNYEVLMIILLVVFIINAIYGKITNERLANKWFKQNKTFFEDNYAHIGAEREYNVNMTAPIIKDSYNGFKFFASGRVYLNWLLVNLELKKRQDLISILTSMFLFNEKDKLVYEASLLPSGDIPSIFSICKKKEAKSMKKNYSDLDFFTDARDCSFLSENLVLLTESYEFVEQIFKDKSLMNLYAKVQPYVDMIYYSDKKILSKQTYSIFFSFDISNNKNAVLMSEFTWFCHTFIDILCSSKVTATYKKEAEGRRAKYDSMKSRELGEKNAEEVKARKEEIKANKPQKAMTREQAQKLDEKEKKEQMKNTRKKMMKVVKN